MVHSNLFSVGTMTSHNNCGHLSLVRRNENLTANWFVIQIQTGNHLDELNNSHKGIHPHGNSIKKPNINSLKPISIRLNVAFSGPTGVEHELVEVIKISNIRR